MSRMLSGFDLIRLEEKLRNEVSEKFGSTVWDSKELVGSDTYEMDMRSWRRMMSTGHTPLTRSTNFAVPSFSAMIGSVYGSHSNNLSPRLTLAPFLTNSFVP